MKVTTELLEQGKSIRGAWSNKQLRALGLNKGFNWNKGWKLQLIGKEVNQEQIDKFLSLKDKHLDKYGANKFDCKNEPILFENELNHLNTIKSEITQQDRNICFHRITNNCIEDEINCKCYVTKQEIKNFFEPQISGVIRH